MNLIEFESKTGTGRRRCERVSSSFICGRDGRRAQSLLQALLLALLLLSFAKHFGLRDIGLEKSYTAMLREKEKGGTFYTMWACAMT